MSQQMLSHVVRSFLPELAIGCACCAGGYVFVVSPMQTRLASAQAEVDALNLAITRSTAQPAAAAQAERSAERARAALAVIDGRSALATDPTAMLQAVSELADRTGVRIEQFNPIAPRGVRGAPGQPAPRVDPKVEQRCAFSVTLTATYADAARFIGAMQQEVGLTAVRSVRMVPVGADRPDVVTVNLETEHLAFDTRAFVAALAAQPAAGQAAGATNP